MSRGDDLFEEDAPNEKKFLDAFIFLEELLKELATVLQAKHDLQKFFTSHEGQVLE